MFINACRLLPSLSQFGQGRLSLVANSFYTLLLLFEPCPLSEFTVAGPLYNLQLLLVINVTGETLNYNPHIHPQGISSPPERRFNEHQELFTVIPDREKILISDIVFRRKLKQHGK